MKGGGGEKAGEAREWGQLGKAQRLQLVRLLWYRSRGEVGPPPDAPKALPPGCDVREEVQEEKAEVKPTETRARTGSVRGRRGGYGSSRGGGEGAGGLDGGGCARPHR